MKYQFIVTYNIYQNGVIVGSGLTSRMSDTFYLSKEVNESIDAIMKEGVKSGYCIADQRITRIKE